MVVESHFKRACYRVKSMKIISMLFRMKSLKNIFLEPAISLIIVSKDIKYFNTLEEKVLYEFYKFWMHNIQGSILKLQYASLSI